MESLSSDASSTSSERLRVRIEQLRPLMKSGIPQFGIAPTDPISFDKFYGFINSYALCAHVAVTGVKVSGTSKFELELLGADVEPLRGTFAVTIPEVLVTADNYSIDGNAAGCVPVSGSGKMTQTLQNVRITGTYQFPKSGPARIEYADVELDVGSAQVNLEGINGMVNKAISYAAPDIVRSNLKHVKQVFKQQVLPQLNEKFGTMTMADINKLLFGPRQCNDRCTTNPQPSDSS